MEFKIDTKEKFKIFTPLFENLDDNLANELSNQCLLALESPVKNIVLNLSIVKVITEKASNTLNALSQKFYDLNSSFVICNIDNDVEAFLDNLEILETLNTTPTESEAMDIVQIEEIERELFD